MPAPALHRQHRPHPRRKPKSAQRGQAMVYGIFILTCSLAALFFLFNTGQMTQEKTKLVNTADAVAYAAGLLHARALNFDAYSNRALVANEMLVAQMVSISSWAKYVETHIDDIRVTPPLFFCQEPAQAYYYPIVGGFYTVSIAVGPEYAAMCNVVTDTQTGFGENYVKPAMERVKDFTAGAIQFIEASKFAIQTAQRTINNDFTMMTTRGILMTNVAKANYDGDGDIEVDVIPTILTSQWGGFVKRYSDDERGRFAEMAVAAANTDEFVRKREWTSTQAFQPDPYCLVKGDFDKIERRGSTQLVDYDQWVAQDNATERLYHTKLTWSGLKCKEKSFPVGEGNQSASSSSLEPGWNLYTGLPSFYDLTPEMVAKTSNFNDGDVARLRFTARVSRKLDQTKTSEGRSSMPTTPVLNDYHAEVAKDQLTNQKVMVQIATAEVFYRRPPNNPGDSIHDQNNDNPTGRTQNQSNELGSLFNPYWQVRLVTPSDDDLRNAKGMQGVAPLPGP
jgi:hypothetical protein